MDETEALELREILAANSDLEERIRSLAVAITYDDEFDIFLVTLGEPQPAITEEIPEGHGLQFRLDPESLKIIGYEILSFRSRYLKAHPEFQQHFDALFEKPPIRTVDIPQTGPQRERANEAIRELIPANA